MILIEGIPVVAARLAAEQKAKDWLDETRRRASGSATSKQRPGARPSVLRRASKAA